MIPTEHNANPASTPRAGLFASLGGLLRVQGTGVPARTSLVFAFLLTMAATLALSAASALAAAPEAPKTEPPTEVKATTASLHGILDPGKTGGPFELDTYEFVYRQSPTECKGAGEVKTPEGLSLGGGKEEVIQGIEGLTANAEYTVCLVAHNEAKTETAVSTPLTFTTALPPEKPETNAPAESVTATTAVLEGVLNPHTAGKAGWYFAYSTGTTCTGASTSSQELAAVVKAKIETKEVTGLEPGKTYRFCLVATNEAGEAATGNEVSFATPVAAPAVESEPASAIRATEARLEGVVNPNNQVTECKFLYGTEPLLTTGTTALCEPASFPASFGGQGVGLNVPGLAQDTTYYYRAIASNPTGTTEGAIEHFTTALPPETPETKPANPITATAATLRGVLNPHGERKSEPGGAEFLYRQSTTECQGESTASVEPATVGNAAEAVKAAVIALRPGATYTFCLRTGDPLRHGRL